MGMRTVAWLDGNVVLFQAVMDSTLGEFLNSGLPDKATLKMNVDKDNKNAGRIVGFLNEEIGSKPQKRGNKVWRHLKFWAPMACRFCQSMHWT